MKKTTLAFRALQISILTSLIFVFLVLPSFSDKVQASTVVSESFTDTNSTELHAHNNNWLLYSGFSSGQTVSIQSNQGVADDDSLYTWNANGDLTTQTVSFDLKTDLDQNRGYLIIYRNNVSSGFSGRGVDLTINTDGSLSFMDEVNAHSGSLPADTVQDNTWYNYRAVIENDTFTIYLNNTQLLTGTIDNASSFASGNGGFELRQAGSIIDNFKVTNTADVPTDLKISSSPSSANVTVGTPFVVDLTVSGGEEPFNAVKATVAVSSNLSITGVQNPSSNSCNLNYTMTPTTSNLSFAGGIFSTSSAGCTVYRLVLTPTSTGTGTLTITSGSVKAYSNNSEILDGVTNGSYSIGTGPTPTPTPSLEFTITNLLSTYNSTFNLSGTKLSNITSIFVNGSDDDSTYPTSTTWQSPVSLALGANTFTLYGSDGTNQTATQTVSINRHTLGDINGDGNVDLIDASLFAVDWDKTEDLVYNLSDMNGDGSVDLTDLSILAKLEE